MNAHQTNVQPDLPGMPEVIGREVTLLQEDVARVEDLRNQCAALLKAARDEVQDLRRRHGIARAKENDLATRTTALDRILAARKRALFEMEQESR